MEKLQEQLIAKIAELIPSASEKDVLVLDSLCRLLATVNGYLLATSNEQ